MCSDFYFVSRYDKHAHLTRLVTQIEGNILLTMSASDDSRKRAREDGGDKAAPPADDKRASETPVPFVFIHFNGEMEADIYVKESGEICKNMETMLSIAREHRKDRDLVFGIGDFLSSVFSDSKSSKEWIKNEYISGDGDNASFLGWVNNPMFLNSIVNTESGKWKWISTDEWEKSRGYFDWKGKPCRLYMTN